MSKEQPIEFQGGRKGSNYNDDKYSKLQHHVKEDMLWGYAPDVESFRQQTVQQDRQRVSSWHSVGGSENSVSSIKESVGNMRVGAQKRANLAHRVGIAVTIAGVSISAALIVIPLMNLFTH